ncbi:hypothetical protein NIES2104_24700 [Leptolyngbya sp. NIES-2104]|nr:hypothetical protein NIES2104_24700 [Leptolyngbya sp. NIES-2104]
MTFAIAQTNLMNFYETFTRRSTKSRNFSHIVLTHPLDRLA